MSSETNLVVEHLQALDRRLEYVSEQLDVLACLIGGHRLDHRVSDTWRRLAGKASSADVRCGEPAPPEGNVSAEGN